MYSGVIAARAAEQAVAACFRRQARDERVLDVAIVGA